MGTTSVPNIHPTLYIHALTICYYTPHGLINFIDIKAKCRHLKQWPVSCKGTLRKVFIRVYSLDILSQSCWYFRPSFVNCCPYNLLFSSTPHPPSKFPVSKYNIYRQCVVGRGLGVLILVGDHILQEFNNLYLTRLKTYKIARPPQTKTWERRGPQTDKHLPQSPFIGKFF